MELTSEVLEGLDWREPESPSSQVARVAWIGTDDATLWQLGQMVPPEWAERAREGLLVVEFTSGGVYVYDDVAEELADGLRFAESAGRFMNTTIKPERPVVKVTVVEE